MEEVRQEIGRPILGRTQERRASYMILCQGRHRQIITDGRCRFGFPLPHAFPRPAKFRSFPKTLARFHMNLTLPSTWVGKPLVSGIEQRALLGDMCLGYYVGRFYLYCR